jgi:FMN phosphatase YigB (HAD superfamily)
MPQLLVLGVTGVLRPLRDLWVAEAGCLADWVAAAAGGPIPEFASLYLRARDREERSPLDAALGAAGLRISASARRQAELLRRAAVPPPAPDAAAEAALHRLTALAPLVLLDRGPRARMERWLRRLGMGTVAGRHLWLDDLGAQARPPSPLGFRWLARGRGLPPQECLYVAGSAALAGAARAAGWRVLAGDFAPTASWDLARLAVRLARD